MVVEMIAGHKAIKVPRVNFSRATPQSFHITPLQLKKYPWIHTPLLENDWFCLYKHHKLVQNAHHCFQSPKYSGYSDMKQKKEPGNVHDFCLTNDLSFIKTVV